MAKTLFVDSTPEIDRLWQTVRAPGDPEMVINTKPVVAADLPGLLAGFDICILDAAYLDEDTLRACPALRHIVYLGTGAASCIDLSAAAKLGIKVSTIKGYGDTTVAEFAMGMMFAAARRIGSLHHLMRSGGWHIMQGIELRGKRLGIVGLGGIGREMARLGRGIGLEVIAWNRSVVAASPVPLVSLDELLARSDVISLHLELNDETRGFLDGRKLAQTKPGVIIVNSARSGIVDEAALFAALHSGQVFHYATDVFDPEPLPVASPWRSLDNVTLTCHAGFNTPEAAKTMYRRAIGIVAASG